MPETTPARPARPPASGRTPRSARRPVAAVLAVALGFGYLLTAVTAARAQVADPSPSDTVEPSPSPSPSPTEDPTSDPSPTDDPTPTSTPPPTSGPSRPPSLDGGRVDGDGSVVGPPSRNDDGRTGHARTRGKKDASKRRGQHPDDGHIAGAFSTALLDAAFRRLTRDGHPTAEAVRRVYRPFIVQGPAAWTDTWHAPRYAGGFHLHEGQDVFCRYGAPVLAATAGTVQFDTNTLGGRVARLFMDDGSYWYYAHLSGWSKTIPSGSTVEVGDVIGYCGNSGDAINSPPHIHFGWYTGSGQAMDPIGRLAAWLHQAEQRLDPKLRDELERTVKTKVEPSEVPVVDDQADTPPPPDELIVATVAFSVPRIVPDRLTAAQAIELVAALALPLAVLSGCVVVRRRRLGSRSA